MNLLIFSLYDNKNEAISDSTSNATEPLTSATPSVPYQSGHFLAKNPFKITR